MTRGAAASQRTQRVLHVPHRAACVGVFATALIEGLAVIVVEIGGARALAPAFGSSLTVWTAQITATLLFLALGYGLGGWLSGQFRPAQVPALFGAAGAWLGLYPVLRAPVCGACAVPLGVAGGSFAAASLLFGVPLLCLGALSPVLIGYLERWRPGAGSAAGALFFTNTLGGLAGGWLTALVVIPYLPLRVCLSATGVLLATLGVLWAVSLHALRTVLCGVACGTALTLALLRRPTTIPSPSGMRVTLVDSRESETGLVQVVDLPAPDRRALLVDGVLQGGVTRSDDRPFLDFVDCLDLLSQRYHPGARTALVLGLGAGLLAKQLDARGLAVAAVDLDPEVADVARRFFGLPPAVAVHIADARTFVQRDTALYDLVFLDAFTAENAPWYLATVEAFAAIRSRLAPHGLLLVNTVTNPTGTSAGLARLEGGLRTVFAQARVFVGSGDPDVVNAVLVAGSALTASADAGRMPREVSASVAATLANERPAPPSAEPATDDWSDVDSADAALRAQWRRAVLADLGADLLGD